MGKLSGKTAVVTGAAKGIGAGIAKALAAQGVAVVVNYAADKAGANRVVGEIIERGGKALAVQGDVSKAVDVRRLFEETKKAFGPVDVLVNNAGTYAFQPLEGVTEAEFRRQFETNVLGPILVTREALRYFRSEGGSVLNISSIVSERAMPNAVIYASSKAALDSVTRVLALELSPRKIRVNTIASGPVDTEGTRTTGIIGSDFEKQAVARTPLGRIGLPDDIAKVAVFLAGDDAGWLTGERLEVAGGFR
jgi:3-oxoacyl-[acyl-carrier protein] reductase